MPPVEAVLAGACPVYSAIPATIETMAGFGAPFENRSFESFADAMRHALQMEPAELASAAKSLLAPPQLVRRCGPNRWRAEGSEPTLSKTWTCLLSCRRATAAPAGDDLAERAAPAGRGARGDCRRRSVDGRDTGCPLGTGRSACSGDSSRRASRVIGGPQQRSGGSARRVARVHRR